MRKTILVTACFMGLIAVLLGAFGAHGLGKIVSSDAVSTFETGVRYQMYHAFFLFVLGLLPDRLVSLRKRIFRCTVLGVLLFSLSIYLLALNSVTAFDFKVIAILTPIGGLLLISAWAMLGYSIAKSKE